MDSVKGFGPEIVYPRVHRSLVDKDAKPFTKVPEMIEIIGNDAKATLESKKVPQIPSAHVIVIDEAKITIYGYDKESIFYAHQTIDQMMNINKQLVPCEIHDWADVPLRGVVEGFYGQPWDHQKRLSAIKFMAQYKMNMYVYGPKDDSYSGFGSDNWKVPYPAEQGRLIAELVREAQNNHIQFVWALHPGSTIKWTDDDHDGVADDVLIAIKKLESLHKLGVRSFAVFFDDVEGDGSNAENQVAMLNYIDKEFIQKNPDVNNLIVCPTQYCQCFIEGTYSEIYKNKLSKNVVVMWTGERVCGPIDEKTADFFNDHFGRKPLIWWNWPVHDYCRPNLLLGRTYDLDNATKDKLTGLVSNPMDKLEASKIPLFGVSDWTWNISGFDSNKNWEDSFYRLFPTKEIAEAMYNFSEHNSDIGDVKNFVLLFFREESVRVEEYVKKALDEYKSSGKISKENASVIHSEFESIAHSGEVLISKLPEANPLLWHEIEYWIRCFHEMGLFGSKCVDFATSDKKGNEAFQKQVSEFQKRMNEFSELQKERHIKDTVESDKPKSEGCKVATKVLMPFIEEISQIKKQ